MKTSDDLLKRMLRTARHVSPETNDQMPPGFATRVAACWAVRPEPLPALLLWERFLGKATLAMAMAALVVGLVFQPKWPSPADDDAVALAVFHELLSEL